MFRLICVKDKLHILSHVDITNPCLCWQACMHIEHTCTCILVHTQHTINLIFEKNDASEHFTNTSIAYILKQVFKLQRISRE